MEKLMYSLIVLMVAILALFFLVFVQNLRLYFYLKNNNQSKWERLTTVGHSAPGMSNPVKWFPYLAKTLPDDDMTESKLKKNIKQKLKITGIIGILLVFNIFLLLFFGLKYSSLE